MKLGIGTAQFGLNYGISNTKGKVSIEQISEILDYAKENALEYIDTASAYGDCESILGRFDLSDFKVITKLFSNDKLELSLKKMNLPSIYGVYIHDENEVDDKFIKKLKDYKSDKLVKKIGVSIYTPDKLLQILDYQFIDIVQIPLNYLDKRFLPFIPILKENNIEIHVRSVFLQGLLLMNPNEINPYFTTIKPLLNKIPMDKLKFALDYIKSINNIDVLIVGMSRKTDLIEINNSFNSEIKYRDYTNFELNDEAYINPSNWRL